MIRCRIRATTLVLFCVSAASALEDVRFVDTTVLAGLNLVTEFGSLDKKYIIEYTGTGAGFSDYDGDGDLDIYLVNGQPLERAEGDEPPRNRLYRNDGRARFTDVTALAGVGDTGWGAGCVFGDIDNDGDPDLFVTNYGPNVLYLNNGDGTFTDISAEAGLDDARWGESAGLGDLDGDGFLDLYVTNHAVFKKEAPPHVSLLLERHPNRVRPPRASTGGRHPLSQPWRRHVRRPLLFGRRRGAARLWLRRRHGLLER